MYVINLRKRFQKKQIKILQKQIGKACSGCKNKFLPRLIFKNNKIMKIRKPISLPREMAQ